jgi:hypothetical protein
MLHAENMKRRRNPASIHFVTPQFRMGTAGAERYQQVLDLALRTH